jgi:hypothetical protein
LAWQLIRYPTASRSLPPKSTAINQQAVREYAPLVEAILHTRSQDTRQIEQTLDGLLSFCGFAPALELYRRLCRHYWEIDPAATAFYVDAYRTTWDD